MLQKMLINKIISLLSKQFKLHKIMKYVEEPNDADDRIDKLEVTVFQQGRLIEFMLNEKSKNKEKEWRKS